VDDHADEPSGPSAAIGEVSLAVVRVRWGFASEGRRRGSPTGNEVWAERWAPFARIRHRYLGPS
jgi:hypothetical protein